jgi:hypothetical protein
MMKQIFISYSRADKVKAELLAKTLINKGWNVWWDRNIPLGKPFDEVIEEALESAACVVVLWSKSSVLSRWVKTEASEGANRNILVPILLEKVEIPLAFRMIQTADLVNWNGEAESEQFIQVLNSIREIVGQEASPHSSLANLKHQTIDEVKLKVFLAGEFSLIDTERYVYLDGLLIGNGTVRKGIDLSVSTKIGKHVLEIKSDKFSLASKPTLEVHFELPSVGEYTIQIKYQSGKLNYRLINESKK